MLRASYAKHELVFLCLDLTASTEIIRETTSREQYYKKPLHKGIIIFAGTLR